MSSSDSASPTRTSGLFCGQDSDVTFQSSNGVLFHVHRTNLDANTAGFPPAGLDKNKVVHLTEDSNTLELLFQFIYPRRHPDLANTTIEVLVLLAMAAEKYEVFPAMNICTIRLKYALSAHPYEILIWAAKHGYSEMVAEAAPLLLDEPLSEMVQKLPQNIAIPWVLYYEKWREVLRKALSQPTWVTSGRSAHFQTFLDDRGQNVTQKQWLCPSCNINLDLIFATFIQKLTSLESLPNLDTLGDDIYCCTHVRLLIQTWKSKMKQQIQQIPTFDKFL